MAQQHLVVQAAMPPQIPFLLQKMLQNLRNMQEKLQEMAKKGKKEFKRRFEGGGFKKSDNPDVIYGRGF